MCGSYTLLTADQRALEILFYALYLSINHELTGSSYQGTVLFLLHNLLDMYSQHVLLMKLPAHDKGYGQRLQHVYSWNLVA